MFLFIHCVFSWKIMLHLCCVTKLGINGTHWQSLSLLLHTNVKVVTSTEIVGRMYSQWRDGKTKNMLFFIIWCNFMSHYFGTLVSVHRTRLREIAIRSCLGVSFSVYWKVVLYIHKFIICIVFQQYVNAEFIRLIRPHAVLWFHWCSSQLHQHFLLHSTHKNPYTAVCKQS